MLTLIFWLLMTVAAHAANLEWDPTADGFLLLEYSTSATGPFEVLKEIPAYPPSYPLSTFGFYRIRVANGGPVSNTVQFSLAVTDTAILELTSKLEGLCRAAKAMGGTATSFAGRIRKEVPCP
jgi:hypothetical protein